MAKPTSKINWTKGNPSQSTISVEPSTGKKTAGWGVNERPPAQTFNWLFQNICEWIDFFEEETDAVAANRNEYDAVVGVDGTHATIPALLADPNIASKKNILVTDPQALSSPVTINQPDMNFTFKPQALISKVGVNNSAIVLDAPRIRFRGARFSGFSAGGDIALQLTTNANYCMIQDNYFVNCDTTIDDQGSLNSLTSNIEEV